MEKTKNDCNFSKFAFSSLSDETFPCCLIKTEPERVGGEGAGGTSGRRRLK